jgi:hypothetical protein
MRLHSIREHEQHFISDHVPEAIIDTFEVVDIHDASPVVHAFGSLPSPSRGTAAGRIVIVLIYLSGQNLEQIFIEGFPVK